MDEIWKPVSAVGFSSIFEISSYGRLRKRLKDRYKMIHPTTMPDKKFLKATLHMGERSKTINVGLETAKVFGVPRVGCKLRYKDGDGTNARVDNLYFVPSSRGKRDTDIPYPERSCLECKRHPNSNDPQKFQPCTITGIKKLSINKAALGCTKYK